MWLICGGVPIFVPPCCDKAVPSDGWREWAEEGYRAELAAHLHRLEGFPDASISEMTLRTADHNVRALRELLVPRTFVRCLLPPGSDGVPCSATCPGRNETYSGARALLSHLARDWGHVTPSRHLYALVVRLLVRRLRHARGKSVLVAGAGLCRLALEFAVKGYRVEALDASAPSLLAASNVLRRLAAGEMAGEVYPHVLRASNVCSRRGQVEPARLSGHPLTPRQVASALPQLTFRVEHLSATMHVGARFHALVTCFFIDSAGLPLAELLDAIHRVLVPGGWWVNAGPLEYHSPATVPLSYEEFLVLVDQHNFTIHTTLSMDAHAYEWEVPTARWPPAGAWPLRRTWVHGPRRGACERSPWLSRHTYTAQVLVAQQQCS